jgi:aminopeptidase N
MFEITIEGIKFYESFFGYPFPFTKYDQLFCPEFNVGAMENPGAVTFNDLYVFKEETTIDRRTSRGNTITHELSHMWFGDLVTMKWWNDLWLNESFAEYISHLCLSRANLKTIKLADVWLQFFDGKGWGYREDQLATTHPIAGEVLNTEQAETIFDGITYSKGAACLKQILCLIGEENFSKAMKSYFEKYQWSNATLDDFINNLQAFYHPSDPSFPQDLNVWKQEWLCTAGLNEAKPEFNPENKNEKAELHIHQSAALPQHPTLRHHKLKIAFLNDKVEVYEVKDVVLKNTATTTIHYDGTKAPKAVLLNYDDEAYIKIRLDVHSIEFLKQNLAKISSEFIRALIWRALWDMTRDGQLSIYEFIEVAVNAIHHEPSDSILTTIFGFCSAGAPNYAPKHIRQDILYPKLFDATLKLLVNTDPSQTNRIVVLRENLIRYADVGANTDVDNLKQLLEWFHGTHEQLKKVELLTDNKWSIVSKLYHYTKLDHAQKAELFKKVAEKDQSDTMKTMEKKCEAIIADHAKMKQLWESFLDEKSTESMKLQGAAMSGFNHSIHEEELAKYHAIFFDNVLDIFKKKSRESGKEFYYSLFPNKDTLKEYLAKVKDLQTKLPPGEDWLLKILKKSSDDFERRIKCTECLLQYLDKHQIKH